MERVLFISSRPIYPTVGGERIRTAQQLEFLISRYTVDVVYMANYGDLDSTEEFLHGKANVKKFLVPKYKNYIQTVRFLTNKLPLQVNYYYNRKVQKYINNHIISYSILFCNNIRTAEYAMKYSNVCKYMDFVDAISMNYERAKKNAKGIMRLIYKIDYKRCKKYERLVLNTFDSCSIISEIDKSYLLGCKHI